MFRSFTARLTALQVGLIVALLLVVTLGHAISGLLIYAKTIEPVDASLATHAARHIERERARGATLKDAATEAVAAIPEIASPWIRMSVYDANRQLIAGQRPPRRSFGDRVAFAVAVLMGMRPADAPVAGGVVVVAPSTDRFREQLIAYLLQTLPFAIIAIAIAVFGGRLIAAQAVRPLVDVTSGLRALAGGDFTPRPIVTAERDEIGELARAYNDAAIQVQTAFAERDRVESQMRQFIADAGHELRTPLTVVMGYLDALKDGIVNEPSKTARVYTTMIGECRRMRAMIQHLIYLARLDATERPAATSIDVASLVQQVAATLEPLAPNLAVAQTDGQTGAVVFGDPNELREAITNIVDNAIKYAIGAPIHLAVVTDDRTVAVEIRDDGPGMSAEDAAHAFDRFHRGSDRGDVEGSGLGLAIARRAVERMDGTITLGSQWGKGTTVTIRLPRAAAG